MKWIIGLFIVCFGGLAFADDISDELFELYKGMVFETSSESGNNDIVVYSYGENNQKVVIDRIPINDNSQYKELYEANKLLVDEQKELQNQVYFYDDAYAQPDIWESTTDNFSQDDFSMPSDMDI